MAEGIADTLIAMAQPVSLGFRKRGTLKDAARGSTLLGIVAGLSLLLTSCERQRDILVSNPCDEAIVVLLTSPWDSHESRDNAIEDAWEGTRTEVVAPPHGVVDPPGWIGSASDTSGTIWIDEFNARVDFFGDDIDQDTDTLILPDEICDLGPAPVDGETIKTFWLGDPVERQTYPPTSNTTTPG